MSKYTALSIILSATRPYTDAFKVRGPHGFAEAKEKVESLDDWSMADLTKEVNALVGDAEKQSEFRMVHPAEFARGHRWGQDGQSIVTKTVDVANALNSEAERMAFAAGIAGSRPTDIKEGRERVRAGSLYKWEPNGMDIAHPVSSSGHKMTTAKPGQVVRVVNLPMAPKANTMGQCHIEDPKTKEFLGMVDTASLTPANGVQEANDPMSDWYAKEFPVQKSTPSQKCSVGCGGSAGLSGMCRDCEREFGANPMLKDVNKKAKARVGAPSSADSTQSGMKEASTTPNGRKLPGLLCPHCYSPIKPGTACGCDMGDDLEPVRSTQGGMKEGFMDGGGKLGQQARAATKKPKDAKPGADPQMTALVKAIDAGITALKADGTVKVGYATLKTFVQPPKEIQISGPNAQWAYDQIFRAAVKLCAQAKGYVIMPPEHVVVEGSWPPAVARRLQQDAAAKQSTQSPADIGDAPNGQVGGPRSLYDIAVDIRKNWRPINYGAAPYLSAMMGLDSINDKYGMDDARSIVLYFLSNASTWRGPEAKRIKAELKGMLNAKNAKPGKQSSMFEADELDAKAWTKDKTTGSWKRGTETMTDDEMNTMVAKNKLPPKKTTTQAGMHTSKPTAPQGATYGPFYPGGPKVTPGVYDGD